MHNWGWRPMTPLEHRGRGMVPCPSCGGTLHAEGTLVDCPACRWAGRLEEVTA